MTLVSTKEFSANQEKYFDIALNENQYVRLKPRQGWAKVAKEFVESGNEETFFPDFFNDEDLQWWQWQQK